MNDPKVEELYYRFISDNQNDKFDDAKLLEFSEQGFDFRLDKGMLTARPQKKYSSPDQAKMDVEPILKAWEFSAFVKDNRHRIRFIYHDAKVIDLKPDTNGVTITLQSAYLVATAETVTVAMNNPVYPTPENNYKTSELTDELVNRLKQYTDGRETLPSMAYYILDRLEFVFAGNEKNRRVKLSKILNIDWKVLDKLGKLSNRSDTKIGRHGDREPFPLTQEQLRWLEKAVFRLVERVAEYNFEKNNIITIKMDDFPPLAD